MRKFSGNTVPARMHREDTASFTVQKKCGSILSGAVHT